VPPAVILLKYISVVYYGRFFCQTGNFAGFPLLIINLAVYLCTLTQCVFNMHVCDTTNSLNIEEKNKKRKNTVQKSRIRR
jgi:hypothetical protein